MSISRPSRFCAACGSDQVLSPFGKRDRQWECDDCGGHTLVAPDGSVHFVAPKTMRAAQAAYDAASDPFAGGA